MTLGQYRKWTGSSHGRGQGIMLKAVIEPWREIMVWTEECQWGWASQSLAWQIRWVIIFTEKKGGGVYLGEDWG